jgi:endonuclease YncB( thermonuclease family)
MTEAAGERGAPFTGRFFVWITEIDVPLRTAAMLALLAFAPLPLNAAALVTQSYPATVVRVDDGDTVVVSVPAWANTPFGQMPIRISGIDTPESSRAHAKCAHEITLGKAATIYAKTLAKPGDPVTLTYHGLDKYARIDGALTLKDGRDWAGIMLKQGFAAVYNGKTKQSWCN